MLKNSKRKQKNEETKETEQNVREAVQSMLVLKALEMKVSSRSEILIFWKDLAYPYF